MQACASLLNCSITNNIILAGLTLLFCAQLRRKSLHNSCCDLQGSGKDLIQPVLDNQLKAASPLLVPAKVLQTLIVALHAHSCIW